MTSYFHTMGSMARIKHDVIRSSPGGGTSWKSGNCRVWSSSSECGTVVGEICYLPLTCYAVIVRVSRAAQVRYILSDGSEGGGDVTIGEHFLFTQMDVLVRFERQYGWKQISRSRYALHCAHQTSDRGTKRTLSASDRIKLEKSGKRDGQTPDRCFTYPEATQRRSAICRV